MWKPPYQADVTGVLKPGTNRLEIKITNQWTNRQIGDRSVAPEKRVLAFVYSGRGGLSGSQTLSDAGLIGPVRMLSGTARR